MLDSLWDLRRALPMWGFEATWSNIIFVLNFQIQVCVEVHMTVTSCPTRPHPTHPALEEEKKYASPTQFSVRRHKHSMYFPPMAQNWWTLQHAKSHPCSSGVSSCKASNKDRACSHSPPFWPRLVFQQHSTTGKVKKTKRLRLENLFSSCSSPF